MKPKDGYSFVSSQFETPKILRLGMSSCAESRRIEK
jgi:hypothetical protein